jgi:hypothetical protein
MRPVSAKLTRLDYWLKSNAGWLRQIGGSRQPRWHRERHRHREHLALRVGESSTNRLGLRRDLAEDPAQAAAKGIDVPLERLLLGRGQARREVLLVAGIVQAACSC